MRFAYTRDGTSKPTAKIVSVAVIYLSAILTRAATCVLSYRSSMGNHAPGRAKGTPRSFSTQQSLEATIVVGRSYSAVRAAHCRNAAHHRQSLRRAVGFSGHLT